MILNAGNWYFHLLRFDRGERQWGLQVSRFHPWVPLVTIWLWFGDVTFGHVGDDW